MAMVVAEIRSVYYRALIGLLFPFVFLWTLAESLPPAWRLALTGRALLALAMLSAFSLGVAAIYVLKLAYG